MQSKKTVEYHVDDEGNDMFAQAGEVFSSEEIERFSDETEAEKEPRLATIEMSSL